MMPTVHAGYFLKDGTRVPSVTQVLSRFKDSGGLIAWAWKLGMEGKDYRVVRDQAAGAGTMAHAAAEAWIRGQPFAFEGDPAICQKAEKAFTAFKEWATQIQLRVTSSELPLVSERYRFGGTFDAILMHNGRAMADWKTSQKCYPEYLVQIAAYGKLWEESFPDEPLTAGYHLLRFDKTYGDFHHHWWGELDRAWLAFRHLRALYDIDVELKERVS
jgi:hypothetical protein